MTEERPFWRSAPALAALGAAVAVIASEAVFSTLSGEPAEFALFLGRFHPLAVHLPIGVVLLVAASEALSFVPRYRPRIDPAIGLVLPALVAVSVGAFFLGELLGRAGEYAPRILNLHRRLELFAVIGVCGCLVAWTYQTRAGTPRARLVYRAALGFTLLVMSTGAHFGGTMTHGETYLLRYAPGPLRSLLGGGGEEKTEKAAKPPASAGAEPTLFAQAVAPILKERCAGCHGPDKVKGGLRLDSLEGIQKGGENGKVVTPGAPNESPLLTNILLPLDDDAHMPPPEKPQPTPPEIAILRFWIERGANDKLLLRDALPPPESRLLLEKALGAPPSPPAPSSKTPTNTTPA
ncbi:MAG TPA: c-type cytochrome domain-containing protein, partial [Polyangiaceae bacterium]